MCSAKKDRWFDDEKKVLELIPYLVRQYGFNADQVCEYLEKPWKWEDQWQQYLHHDELLAAQNDDLF